VPGDSFADNCPGINNPDQTDANFNGLGRVPLMRIATSTTTPPQLG
jgi:hypothetical protein